MPSAAYGVNASPESAAWAEAGAGGLPTLGVVTVLSGPLGAAAVHAVRAAQQQARRQRPVRMRIVVRACGALMRAAVPRGGWSGPRAARGRRRPAGRRCCRSAERAAYRPG